MADILWLLFIAAIYLLVLRPMFQGKPGGNRQQSTKSSQQKPHSPPKQDDDKFKDGDYVDYEEIK